MTWRGIGSAATACAAPLLAGCGSGGVSETPAAVIGSNAVSLPVTKSGPLKEALSALTPGLDCQFQDGGGQALFRGHCIDKAHQSDSANAFGGTQDALSLLSLGCLPGMLITATEGDWLTDPGLKASLPQLRQSGDDRKLTCPPGHAFCSHTFINRNLIVDSTDPALDPVVKSLLGPGVVDIESVTTPGA